MAARKRGSSLRSTYRKASELTREIAKLELAYTRQTLGQKSATTKKLKTLRGSLRAYKGSVTKKRKAQAARKGLSTAKRRAAARTGWEKRRASAAPAPSARALERGQTMPFLTADGIIRVWSPSASDRSKLARYWNPSIFDFLGTGSTASLEPFKGDSIYDEISDRRLRFITDPDVILEHADEFTFFELSFYKRREEAA
ncbi:MAG: hypothetical protein WBE30_14460 [Candidatus Cybelea sp.]|jgi:hypothetical protein